MEDRPDFLDVSALIERSQPRPRVAWFWYAVGLFLLLIMTASYLTTRHPELTGLVNLLSGGLMFLLVVGISGVTFYIVQRQRGEQQQLEGLEELVQLRRWPEAARLAHRLLGRPTWTPVARVQGLIYLSMILARYHRFEDAIRVQDHILQSVRLDPQTEYGLKLGRAMAMLREDHLFDADRAINELRRLGEGKSGGLALVEIYRDVKTGHPQEAVEMFSSRLTQMKTQLGHRVGDAYALAAKAFDLLGRDAEARRAWLDATVLTAVDELKRRYPELATLEAKYGLEGRPPE
jgi:hypothetical protein